MLNVRLFVIQQTSRQFSTNNVKLNIVKQSRYMNRFIKGCKLKGDPFDFSNSSIFGQTKKTVSLHVKRRVNVLNNVFMQHITDLLSTGEIEPELLKRNIEISHVDIRPNFKLINIFWIDNDINKKPDTPELLKKCSYRLRYELCQLHIVGKIPIVQFVECRGISKMKEIEEKLKTLDFGEEHEPSTYPYAVNQTVTVKSSTNIEKEVSKNKNLEDTNDTFSVTLPEMRHNVFDLNHHIIMSRIKTVLNKSRAALKEPVLNTRSSLTSFSKLDSQNEPDFVISREQQKQFSKFLEQRRKEQRYKNKQKYCKADIIYNVPEEEEEEAEEENFDCDDYNEDDTDDKHNIDNYYKDYIHREAEDKQ